MHEYVIATRGTPSKRIHNMYECICRTSPLWPPQCLVKVSTVLHGATTAQTVCKFFIRISLAFARCRAALCGCILRNSIQLYPPLLHVVPFPKTYTPLQHRKQAHKLHNTTHNTHLHTSDVRTGFCVEGASGMKLRKKRRSKRTWTGKVEERRRKKWNECTRVCSVATCV